MKTSNLIGAALDWAVAKCEGIDFYDDENDLENMLLYDHESMCQMYWKPSTDWAQGGPIIERETLSLCPQDTPAGEPIIWDSYSADMVLESGGTALIAAMRCYVASKIGEEIDIPVELL